MSIREAAANSAELRFRAILMTSFSSILGFLAVVGGMIAATCFSLLFVPSFSVVFRSLGELGSRSTTPPQTIKEATARTESEVFAAADGQPQPSEAEAATAQETSAAQDNPRNGAGIG